MAGYWETVLLHAESPGNVGWLDDANAAATKGSPGSPPFMATYLQVEDGRLAEARYRTFGRGPAIAVGSLLTEMIAGRRIDDRLTLTDQDLTEALGGLPPEKTWCAGVAISPLRKTLQE